MVRYSPSGGGGGPLIDLSLIKHHSVLQGKGTQVLTGRRWWTIRCNVESYNDFQKAWWATWVPTGVGVGAKPSSPPTAADFQSHCRAVVKAQRMLKHWRARLGVNSDRESMNAPEAAAVPAEAPADKPLTQEQFMAFLTRGETNVGGRPESGPGTEGGLQTHHAKAPSLQDSYNGSTSSKLQRRQLRAAETVAKANVKKSIIAAKTAKESSSTRIQIHENVKLLVKDGRRILWGAGDANNWMATAVKPVCLNTRERPTHWSISERPRGQSPPHGTMRPGMKRRRISASAVAISTPRLPRRTPPARAPQGRPWAALQELSLIHM